MSAAARIFALCGAFAAGVLLAEATRPPPGWILGLGSVAVVGTLAAARAGRAFATAASCVILAAGCGLALTGLRLASIDGSGLARGAARGADAVIVGEVLSDPVTDGDAVRFVLGARTAEIDGLPVRLRERAWTTVRPAAGLRAGAIVRLEGRLAPLVPPDADDRVRAAARRLLHRGIAARAFASADGVSVIGRTGNLLARAAEAARRGVRRAATRLPDADAGLLLGLTIGDTSQLDPVVDADFRTTGLSHLVAVSGANVAIVLSVVAFGLRLAGAGRRSTVAVLALCVLAFMAVTRFEPSVLRAGAMAGLALAGTTLGARRASTVALAVAVLGLLAFDPFLIHSVGFQLSVVATLGILVVAPRVAEVLPPGPLWAAAAVTLGAQAAVAPILLLHFRSISVVALAANVLAAPLVAPVTIAGMLAGTIAAVWAPGGALALVAGPPLVAMRWVARALAAVPGASVGTPGGLPGLTLAAALTFAAVALARGARPRRLAPIALALALIATGGVWARAVGPAPLRGLVVTMIDVGQGDAFVVRAGGASMLIDGGPDRDALLGDLRALGVWRVDLLVVSHPHLDHVEGLAGIAEHLPVGRVLDPFIPSELPSYRAIVRSAERRRIPRERAAAGATYALGPARVDVLWPPARHLEGTAEDVNNNSIVLRVRYGGDSVLFAGETQEEAQEELLRRPFALRARVLKVSHHGSARMLPRFYEETRARLALIPVGRNTFGHPAAETLVALRGMRILRSDESGTVSLSLDGTGAVEVRTERAA